MKQTHIAQTRRTQYGFTMMELLVVLVIVGLLAALVGPVVYKRISPAKAASARAQIEHFGTALDAYFIDNGRFPSTREGLIALRQAPANASNWNGPYLKKNIPQDPWGSAYRYLSPGTHGAYEISSLGADSKEGGEGENADIFSWQND